MTNEKKEGLQISAVSFLTAIGVLAALMAGTYLLTVFIPAGAFERTLQDGKETIIAGTYHTTEGGIPFWRWLLSPVLVLGSSQGSTLIAVMAFLLIIGGTFHSLDRSGTMDYMLRRIVKAASHRKYVLLAVVVLFFLSMGAFMGSYEECIPMVPLAVSLAVALNWDKMIGIGMSLGAVACGFATGVLNPFTTGVAQTLMDLPMFSGLSLRILSYIVVYGCLLLFLIPYAKKCEKRNTAAVQEHLVYEFQTDSRLERSMRFFAGTIVVCLVSVVIFAFIPALSGILMVVVAFFFLIAGVGSCICASLKGRQILAYFLQGVKNIMPSMILILMAGSIQYTMSEAGILDTILNYAVNLISSMSPYEGILCIFLFTMIINFFIASGSAEAVLLMPLLGPLADLCGISRQLTVLAYNYGDGFSNLIYFTNPSLLIALSLVNIGYGKWLKWSMKLQVMIAVCCCLILLLGAAAGY